MVSQTVVVGKSDRQFNDIYRGKGVVISFGEPEVSDAKHGGKVTLVPYDVQLPDEDVLRKHAFLVVGAYGADDLGGFKASVMSEFENGTSLALSPIREITKWQDYYSPDELARMGFG